jgi:isopentenyl-diphosphate delta-isomerase
MEYLDIISEKDKVVGRATRNYIHKNHLTHRGVHVFVINNKGEILIQKRSKFKKDRPGCFDSSIGAQVNSNESYREAAVREAYEELGVKLKKEELIKVCKYKAFTRRQRELRILYILIYYGPFKIDKEEVEWIKFYNVKVIKKLLKDKNLNFTNGFKLSFKLYLRYLHKK